MMLNWVVALLPRSSVTDLCVCFCVCGLIVHICLCLCPPLSSLPCSFLSESYICSPRGHRDVRCDDWDHLRFTLQLVLNVSWPEKKEKCKNSRWETTQNTLNAAKSCWISVVIVAQWTLVNELMIDWKSGHHEATTEGSVYQSCWIFKNQSRKVHDIIMLWIIHVYTSVSCLHRPQSLTQWYDCDTSCNM